MLPLPKAVMLAVFSYICICCNTFLISCAHLQKHVHNRLTKRWECRQ